MSELNPSPHLAVVTAGIEMRGLTNRLNRLESSIEILATRKAPQIDDLRQQAEHIRIKIDEHRRLIEEINTNGYEWYRENYEAIAGRYQEGDGVHPSGEDKVARGTEGDAVEAQTDPDGTGRGKSDAQPKKRSAKSSS